MACVVLQGVLPKDMNRRRGGCGYRVWAGSAACAVSTNRSSTVGASLTKNALCPEVWLSECAVSECATGSRVCRCQHALTATVVMWYF